MARIVSVITAGRALGRITRQNVAESPRPVDRRRLFHLDGDLLHELLHHEDADSVEDQRDDQPGVRVDQPELLEEDEARGSTG